MSLTQALQRSRTLIYFILICSIGAGCRQSLIPRTTDWWKYASDQQAVEIVYRSYCSPDPPTCLPKQAYKTQLSRANNFFVVGFEHYEGNLLIGFVCSAKETKLSCAGSGRDVALTNRIKDYPIIWDDAAK
jgi:hypothetical protein